MQMLEMDSLDSKPKKVLLPDNIGRSHKETRVDLFNKLLGPVVEILMCTMVKPESPKHVEIVFVDKDIGEVRLKVLDTELKSNNGVNVTVQGKKFHFQTKVAQSDEKDCLRNYSLSFLKWALPYFLLKDSIKEGDTFRSNACLKCITPLFYSHSTYSKYAIECIDYLLKTEALLSPQLAWRCRLGSFVNTKGQDGGNKPCDMQQENNVRSTKDVFKGLGAGKADKSLERTSAAAPVMADIDKHYENILEIHLSSSKHSHRVTDEDVTCLLDSMKTIEPFLQLHRSMGKVKIPDDPLSFNHNDFLQYLQRTVNRLTIVA